jgi:hypothetical protein
VREKIAVPAVSLQTREVDFDLHDFSVGTADV